MWDLPGPGLEPMSLALAGGFLTTEPPGKSLQINLETHLLSTCPVLTLKCSPKKQEDTPLE